MPNPFPGVDPYLEGPDWPGVHDNLVVQIALQLGPKLRPKYVAVTSSRIVLATPDPIEAPMLQVRVPDVRVRASGLEGTPASGTTLVAPLTYMGLIPEEMTQKFVEIRETESKTLVAAIEVLSPTNKRGDGLDEFRKKRRELLAEPTHYVEIDLLRTGDRFPVTGVLPSVQYFVFLSRANRRPCIETWPIALDQPLPEIPIPLLKGDPDVSLDLQLAWNTNYEALSYDIATNHAQNPTVPLSEEQQAWADERLRQAGLKT
ncbi:MAG: DUF4058 family protein [Planctomycetaceae bacterium]